jgi:hypothetical protein
LTSHVTVSNDPAETAFRKRLYERFLEDMLESLVTWKARSLPITDDLIYRLACPTLDDYGQVIVRSHKDIHEGFTGERNEYENSEVARIVPTFRLFRGDQKTIEDWVNKYQQQGSGSQEDISTNEPTDAVALQVILQLAGGAEATAEEKVILEEFTAEPILRAFVPFDEEELSEDGQE